MPNRMVQPTHFEDFDGHQFERLVFAYLLRTDNWQSLEWYGQTGGDSGRDIWGVKERDGYPQGQKVCVQCSNWKSLTYAKAREDFEKVLSRPNGKPDVFFIVVGGTVSAAVRDKTKKLCERKQVNTSEIWSGTEFEERLRGKAESLLKRFIAGEEFPDAPDDLRSFANAIASQSDDEILALMAELFERPAFYTPFHQESSVPVFKKAITDTIEALNTGIRRLRDGTEIRRIPSRHALKSAESKRTLAQIERMLAELRARYDEYIGTGDIRPCSCGVPDCSVFVASPKAADEMNRRREEVLVTFHELYEPFDVRLGWNR